MMFLSDFPLGLSSEDEYQLTTIKYIDSGFVYCPSYNPIHNKKLDIAIGYV
ncbi:hypothetical protein KSI01_25930 [Kurthia sibirica]|nr:hypothetical protein KSI01_25930 [Kurthia sibirica]